MSMGRSVGGPVENGRDGQGLAIVERSELVAEGLIRFVRRVSRA